MSKSRSFDYFCSVPRIIGAQKYGDIGLSEIKLLSLKHDETGNKLARVDAVLRDLHGVHTNQEEISDTKASSVDGLMDRAEAVSVVSSSVHPSNKKNNIEKIIPRVPYSITFTYEGDPEIIIGSIENYIKLHGVRELPPQKSANYLNTCQHCTSKEVVQTQKLCEIKRWRKRFMNDVGNISKPSKAL